MDQAKIGSFLAELRKESNLTQEQLAEKVGVARRTISRWETGSNLPDIDLLIELSDLYDVDLREILDGARKKEMMDPQTKETVLKVAEYSETRYDRVTKTTLIYSIVGIISAVIHLVVDIAELPDNMWTGMIRGGTLGLILGALLLVIIYLTGNAARFCEFKKRIFKMDK